MNQHGEEKAGNHQHKKKLVPKKWLGAVEVKEGRTFAEDLLEDVGQREVEEVHGHALASEINFVEISFEFREIYDSRSGASKANIARKFRLNLNYFQYVMILIERSHLSNMNLALVCRCRIYLVLCKVGSSYLVPFHLFC